MTFFPSAATTRSTKPSNLARSEYGVIGSTLPLLEIEDRKVSRVACTTATRADGRRLFKYSRTTAKTIAKPKQQPHSSAQRSHASLTLVFPPSMRRVRGLPRISHNCSKTHGQSCANVGASRRLVGPPQRCYIRANLRGWAPVVFIVSGEWDLRGACEPNCAKAGIEALGMETVEDMAQSHCRRHRSGRGGSGRRVICIAHETRQALQNLVSRLPVLVIDSRLNPAPPLPGAQTILRPVQVKEIVAARIGHARLAAPS